MLLIMNGCICIVAKKKKNNKNNNALNNLMNVIQGSIYPLDSLMKL